MTANLDLVVIISGNGSNLQSIIDAVESGNINARIRAVISNNPDAYGLTRAQSHGFKNLVVNHRDFDSRAEFDEKLRQTVNEYKPDYIVLAGFMRILGSDFIQAYRNKILNIHPSILPDYKGLNTHQRALDNGENEHGVSIHMVTAELDDGPIILRGRYPISTGDTVADLQSKGHALEHRMYPKVLGWLSSGDLKIKDQSIFFKKQIQHGAIEFEQVN